MGNKCTFEANIKKRRSLEINIIGEQMINAYLDWASDPPFEQNSPIVLSFCFVLFHLEASRQSV